MDSSTKRLILIAILILAGVTMFSANIKEWIGFKSGDSISTGKEQNSSSNSASDQSMVTINPFSSELEIAELRQHIATLPLERQRELLSDSEKFQLFIKKELAQKSILKKLIEDGALKQPKIQFLLQKTVEKALFEAYLNQNILKSLASDFPSEAQIKEFYEANKDSYYLEDRIHLWQILLPINVESSKQNILDLENKASSVRQEIIDHRLTFAEATSKYSANKLSRSNDGYIGLVKLSELPDNVKDQIMLLEKGQISQPIRTELGIHIMKHEGIVEGRIVELEQVGNNIREVLRQNQVSNIQKALIEEAQKKYPSNLEANDIEEWRLKLRSGL